MLILVSIKRQFQVVYIDMKHDWKKATHSGSGSQRQGRVKFAASFSLGSPSSQGGTTPKLKDFGNNFYMNRQRTYCY